MWYMTNWLLNLWHLNVFVKLLSFFIWCLSVKPLWLICPMHGLPISRLIFHNFGNWSYFPPVHQNSACFAPEHTGPALKPENMHHPFGSGITNAFSNGGSALHSSIHTAVDMSAHTNRIDAPPSMLPTQSSNMGLMQALNGGMIKSEAGYSGASPYIFSADGNVLEARPSIPDASVASLSSVESSSQALNEPLLDADTSSYGFLDQIPPSFSLSDLTAHFAQSSGFFTIYLCLLSCKHMHTNMLAMAHVPSFFFCFWNPAL